MSKQQFLKLVYVRITWSANKESGAHYSCGNLPTRVRWPPPPHVTRWCWLFLLSTVVSSSKRSPGWVNSLALQATESGPLPSVFFLSDSAGLSMGWASNLFPPASHQQRGPSAANQRLSLVPWSAWSPGLSLGTVRCHPVWFPLSFPHALVVAVAVFFGGRFGNLRAACTSSLTRVGVTQSGLQPEAGCVGSVRSDL